MESFWLKQMSYKVKIIGVGPGTNDYLLPIARRKIEDADCLIGAKRLIGLFRHLGKEEVYIEGHFDEAIAYIKKYKAKKKIVLLVSGDPGIYSLIEKLSKQLNRNGYDVIPGISTIQLAFAKIKESWHDAKVISLHGRKVRNLAKQLKDCPKAFLLTDRHFPPNKIAEYLLKEGLENREAVVLENLSYLNERIIKSDLRRLSKTNGWDLSVMILRDKKEKTKNGKLYGVGIGPGDPKLVTLKAKEILDKADIIFVPKGNEDGSSWARSIVEGVISTDKDFRELTFPMTTDKNTLSKYWLDAAYQIVKEVNKGKEVAFVTIGDPFIYSTYIYLLKTIKNNFSDIDVETVPGVSAFNAASSMGNFALVEGYEKLAVIPVTNDLAGLKEAIRCFDTVVLMKVGSKLDKALSILKELRLLKNSVLISRVGHEDEKIIYDLTSLKDKKMGYLSVIVVKKDWKR